MNNTEDARDALKTTADYLSKVPYASKRLLFVADTIKKYLNGEEPTLDRAFGFTKGRGKYEREYDEAHILLVYEAIKMQFSGKPWKTISELSGYSEKEFRPIWNRYKSLAIERMADKIHIDFDAP